MKTIRRLVIVCCVYILIVIGFPYGIMKYYSVVNYDESFLNEEGIEVKMAAGRRYWPFVLNYNPTVQYSRVKGEDIDLDIYYNFAGIGINAKSGIYREGSDYYNAFYGAYVIRYNDREFDLSDEYDEIMDISDFDLKTLVLRSIGDDDPYLDYKVRDDDKQLEINGLDYKVVDADMVIDGFAHNFDGFHLAYIQYGIPYRTEESFSPVQVLGRMYIHYIPEKNINVILYIIAPNNRSLKYMEDNFILSTKISNID